MRAIQYAAPHSVEEAISLLQQIGSKARILAGGTDLIVQVGAGARDIEVFVEGMQVSSRLSENAEIYFAPAITGADFLVLRRNQTK